MVGWFVASRYFHGLPWPPGEWQVLGLALGAFLMGVSLQLWRDGK